MDNPHRKHSSWVNNSVRLGSREGGINDDRDQALHIEFPGPHCSYSWAFIADLVATISWYEVDWVVLQRRPQDALNDPTTTRIA